MKWIANFSNGSTAVEGKPIAGEITPWQGILKYMRENQLKMTGIRLEVNDLIVYAMPYKMCDGYFHAYEIRKSMYSGGENRFQGIGSIVKDLVFINWVNLVTNEVTQEVRTLEECRVHTTSS